ncbi:taurine transport protein (ABC superfamily, ATP_bind) [Cupriavidus basilensis OR16]|uniref:Taurine transport protein (ABC superfamily, ATP_bind) n=1 Tax=Cupriavidus basilensis OR16 TaxID=1127483 RepID=H1S539_9BURK|nr:ABC transporter ATP-binding protein [Cupriavidus basilensis]EHP42390.1 taurine transport protein (ABC superfamily, ATP_bind) [Cupriavidus basilensis OR16]
MARAGTLNIAHLRKQYEVKGEPLPVLEDITLSIAPGEFVSIVGASGCGKSTLLRLVVGLEEDYKGEILLDGKRVVGTSLDRGIVFQEHRLFPWLTVEQNIRTALLNAKLSEADKRRTVREHIALVGLAGFETAFPHQLSGGMSQRVAIARALVTRPEILLLDEPFGALDALTRAYLQQELHRIWQAEGITMILVTHDVEEAIYLGDRVVVMEPRPGRIRRILPVPLAHPRDRAALGFARVKDDVLQEFTGRLADLAEAPIKRDAAAQYTDRLPPNIQFAI